MRVFLSGIAVIMLALGLAASLSAQESGSRADVPEAAAPETNYDAASFIGADDWLFHEFSKGRRVGAGFLNLFLGLGSFTMGDVDGGFGVMGRQVAGLVLTVFGTGLLVLGTDPAIAAAEGAAAAMGPAVIFFGPFLLLGPMLVISVAIVCEIVGIPLYVSSLIYGFRRPMVFEKPAKTARLNDVNNWDIAVAPDANGNPNGYIAFTAHL